MNLPPFALTLAHVLSLPEAVPLWDAAPLMNTAAMHVEEKIDGRDKPFLDRFVRDVTLPTLTPFLPEPGKATGKAVVICPGGGYSGLAIDKEGYDIARWFASFGVAGCVLKYRSPNPTEGPPCQPYGPLRDAQRALRIVRSRAAEWRVDPEQVGIMGFSAGGHLAASASTLFADSDETDPALGALSCRPSFTVLIYPVVTFTVPGVMHEGSRDNLLGREASVALRQTFSCELQVTSETPPAFLIHAGNDPVPVANSLLYYQALQKHGIPAELHVFAQGGHGYGMHPQNLPVDSWTKRCQEWLETAR